MDGAGPQPAPPLEERLARFVADQIGAPVEILALRRISSVGNAREPWSFTARWEAGHLDCVLLLQAAAGQLESDLGREFDTIAALAGTGVPAPPALWADTTGTVLGHPFFVTERVPGDADTRLLRRVEQAPVVRAVALELATAAARLHGVDPVRARHLPAVDRDRAATDQLTYWAELFDRQRLEPHPTLVYLINWLRRDPPTARRLSIVHGDLRFGNLLYDGPRLTALLDWEMVHVGDPVEDLGWVYRALWTPERALPFPEFLAAYVDAGGDPVDPAHLRWYQVLAEVKHAVISLTGGRSFADRATLSLRHADRAATVPAFVRRALELVGAPC